MEDHVSPVSEAKAREMRGVKGDDGVGVGDDGVSSATEVIRDWENNMATSLRRKRRGEGEVSGVAGLA
ncbi:hypothetical protein OsJ_06376 [Oryza sativa Japonica Group]|uniref:Uncharacterized protein n=1 Tax=Oryza sativa subsp. japonica TaxID=39947 RepID=A3A5W5_ORYSJ|nr:hypothetical protein OsJ_06376 [Oryza sativa Japonica Group]